jgi:N-acetylmuramoyl-L-alanine amidase
MRTFRQGSMMSKIVSREEWGAKYGRGNATSGAKTRWAIHHDGNDRAHAGSTFEEECAVMRMFEQHAVDTITMANPRISYSFVTFPSSRIYEACGWGRIGAHTKGFNSSAYANQFPINGRVTAPTQAQLDGDRWLRMEGIRLGHLSAKHSVGGHRDFVPSTDCPGRLVYEAAVLGVAPVIVPSVKDSIDAQPSLRKGKGGRGAPVDIVTAVLTAQKRLVELGFLTPAALATGPGTFGPATDRATRRFQQSMGLLVDGIIGPKTWKALLR